MPASKSRQSLRPRASSRTLLSPEASSRPSSRSPLLSAMSAGAATGPGRAAATAPHARNFQEFHGARRRAARRRLLPGSLPAASSFSALAAPPRAGEGARPPPGPALPPAVRRLPTRGRPGRGAAPRAPGEARRRLPASRGWTAAPPGAEGKSSLRRAVAGEEDSTHSSARRRLPAAGCPSDPQILTGARGLIWAAGPRGRCGAETLRRRSPPRSRPGCSASPLVHFCDPGRVTSALCASVALRGKRE